jgi:hypothetical protein
VVRFISATIYEDRSIFNRHRHRRKRLTDATVSSARHGECFFSLLRKGCRLPNSDAREKPLAPITNQEYMRQAGFVP